MGDHAGEDTARKKRSRAELKTVDTTREDVAAAAAAAAAAAKKDDVSRLAKPVTPPPARRTSGTPTIGVEIQIPSRPATPGPSSTPMATTPIAAPLARSPLIPDEPNAPRQHQKAQPLPAETDAQPQEPDKAPAAAPPPVNEDEWAAFEAELVHGTATANNKPVKPAIAALDSDAVISAPVMTAAEIAVKSKEEEAAKRRALVDIQLEDEKEEATRALETEFEVMEELEARARKLRERREALRLQGGGGGTGPAVAAAGDVEKGVSLGKENAANPDDDDEEDEEEEDDWDGFRFRA
jgi:zinc finger protein 830